LAFREVGGKRPCANGCIFACDVAWSVPTQWPYCFLVILIESFDKKLLRKKWPPCHASKAISLSCVRGPRARASRITLPNQTRASRTWIVHGAISVSLTHFIGSLPVARG